MSKSLRRGVMVGALAVLGMVMPSFAAGVLGPVGNTDPAHDLNETLTTAVSGNSADPNFISGSVGAGSAFDFKFTGVNSFGAFLLAGSYDGAGNVSTTSYSATGHESIGDAAVSYNGTISVLDIGAFSSSGTLKFLMTPNTGPGSIVWVNARAGAADISPVPVPLPSAVGSGVLVLALLGGGAWVRRRLAV